MSNKNKLVKKILCFTIICSFILLVFYNGTINNVKAEESETTNIIKPTKFKTFDEYVSYLKKLNLGGISNDSSIVYNSLTDNKSETSIVSNTVNTTAPEYGTTNIQVEGVDEADVIKNDGKYIYILNKNNNTVKIINPKPANNMSEVGVINLTSSNYNNYRYYNDMYLCEDKLVIIYSYNINQSNDDIIMPLNNPNIKVLPNNYGYNKSFVCADIYNVFDKSNVKFERSIMNEGNLNSSRMIGNTLYMISNKYLDLYIRDEISPYTKGNLLVAYSDSKISDELKYASVDSMYCVLDKNNPYTMQNLSIISSVDITKDSELKICSFTGFTNDLYMSSNNIYMFGQSWDNCTNYTDIYKYNIDGTNVTFASCNRAVGYMLNQFCADEYNGNLRIATTDWSSGNNVFIFDKDMIKIGQITELAKGEQIKSCRFIGDKGYVVTYRTMDPLFVLNLSIPSNPIVAGELKIPGFSSYLHPVSDNIIIGIGESTTPLYWHDENGKEIEAGVKQIGIKVSLFDVSNSSKPVELKAITIGGPGSYTDIGYDHKAFTLIKDKNLIAIRGIFTPKPINGVESSEYKQQAILISYRSNTLHIEKIFEGNYSYETGNRITYIGDTLYHFTGSELNSYSFDNYSKLGTLFYE